MNEKNLALAVELRHALHAHPELSNEEVWTRNTLMAFLRQHTNLEIVDRGKWFYALYRAAQPKRRIAFRADFDALPIEDGCGKPYASTIPGCGHKCGHDGHSAALAAFALEVNEKGADSDIYFVFQHAEEIGDGGQYCAEIIREDGIDEVFAFHNWPGYPHGTVCVKDGCIHYASKGMIIRMVGTPSHASMPECGRTPAYAFARIIEAVPGLNARPWKGEALTTVIGMQLGEKAFGTQASEGEVYLTIRADSEAELDALSSLLEKMAEEGAKEYGLTLSVEYCDVFPDTVNDPASTQKIRDAAAALGYPVAEMPMAERGSEDFGYFTKYAPGALFFIGAGEDAPQLHTAPFDFDDTLIPMVVAMYEKLI